MQRKRSVSAIAKNLIEVTSDNDRHVMAYSVPGEQWGRAAKRAEELRAELADAIKAVARRERQRDDQARPRS